MINITIFQANAFAMIWFDKGFLCGLLGGMGLVALIDSLIKLKNLIKIKKKRGKKK
jgi:hypothetical protein